MVEVAYFLPLLKIVASQALFRLKLHTVLVFFVDTAIVEMNLYIL
jgi:hypothetical protein